jgi:predicted nucleotide-binding protein
VPPADRSSSSVSERIRSMPQPTAMFIGSSSEGLRVAQMLQAELERDVDASVWSQGVFGLSGSTLEGLVEVAQSVRFAAFVLTPDDLLDKRGSQSDAPRDNVIFEAGLFMGALGRRNTFLVSCRDDHLELPSDLAGITQAQYNRRSDLRAAIGPAATAIRAAIEAANARLPTASVARAAFEQPQNRSVVERTPTITGRSCGITEGTELWAVVVTLRPERRYHPQVAALTVTSNGTFDATAYIGLADSTGIFQLLLVLVDKTDGDRFRQYMADANRDQTYVGLQTLPPSSGIVDEIVVTRA